MQVRIGRYISWWGPYQIAELLQYVGVSEDRCHKIGAWLADTWVGNVCQSIHDRRQRDIKVVIEPWDTWSADHTLALVILPVLKQYRTRTVGSPMCDDEDVPEYLKSTSAPPVKQEYDTDDNFHKRWQYIVDQMIWSFEQIVNDDALDAFYGEGKSDPEGYKVHQDLINNGLRLFGKYYQGLWT